MQDERARFSLIERMAVVAILLFVTVIALHNLLQSVSESEERTLNKAAVEYSAVKDMYAEQRQFVPPAMGPAHTVAVAGAQKTPID
jgi:type II secretory pathway pseudopilin PulG